MTLYEKSQDALDDWRDMIEYTLDRHGESQTHKYSSGLLQCVEAMAKSRGYFKDISINNRKVRVKHCQKHYIFALLREDAPMIVIAFFHERMDLMRRLMSRLK